MKSWVFALLSPPLVALLFAAGCDDEPKREDGEDMASDAHAERDVALDLALEPVADAERDLPRDLGEDAAPDIDEDTEPDLTEDVSEEPDVPEPEWVDLVPFCAHAPNLVTAGGRFPVAIWGQTTGCAVYDHYEVTADGFDIDIRLVGLDDPTEPCLPCIWTYLGLIDLEAPNPGAYTVNVADRFELTVGASGGIVEEPVCQDDCASPALESFTWTLVHLSSQDVTSGCGDYRTHDSAVQFDGSCQDYTLVNTDWSFPTATNHCTDGRILFGTAAPYAVDASVCDPGFAAYRPVILGIANHGAGSDPAAEVFFIESR